LREDESVALTSSTVTPEADGPGEDIENQITSVAGLLATDADYEIPENNDDSHNSWAQSWDDDYSLCLDESGWESRDMAISSDDDDDAIVKNLPPVQKSYFPTQRSEKKSAKGVQERRTVTQEVELSESDSETDPETCGKWVIIYHWL
jgi:hypothetical protein